ncbi:MAG: Uma2 family endonuclease [Bryobacteraceae bacterium]|nr:Uma2 family endonuclease [Bryobacteraceae bacterium]
MVVTVDEIYLPLTLSAPGITDEQFEELCRKYADYRVEYTAEGELVVMPPTDPETSARNGELVACLVSWARGKDGLATESSGGYRLPNGARLAPDASWISRKRLKQQPTCPEFVIELLSPSDRRPMVEAKMREWIANGAELGWMIDPQQESVTIYRVGQEPETRTGIEELAGEGPVVGFVLELRRIWRP